MRLLVVALVLVLPLEVSAEPSAGLVARIDGQGRHRIGPVQAKVGQVVELAVHVAIRGKRYSPLPRGSAVEWRRIVPRMEHVDLPSRREGLQVYSNSELYGPRHGRWVGYDSLEYEEAPFAASDEVDIQGVTLRLRGAGPEHGGAGSTWIAASVTLPDGLVVRTPGLETSDPLGLARSVMRVSFRSGDDFPGWLTTFFGVPYVFGSTGRQADRYTGADCADAMVGAMRASGARLPYVSVRSINRVARPVSPVLFVRRDGAIRDGSGRERALHWGREARRGDLLVMDFLNDPDSLMPGPWDHIGVLLGDRSTEGFLDGQDLLRHMASRGLEDVPVLRMGAIRFRLFRWNRGF